MRLLIAAAVLTFGYIPELRADADGTARTLVASAKFKAAKASIDQDYDRIVAETIALTQIPAPPFHEQARATRYLAMFREAGLADVEIDAEGNVLGYRRGSGHGPVMVVAAHLDTVFPSGTPVTVRQEGNVLHAPGIGDDTASLAVLLSFVRAMDTAGYRTREDILFVGDVGEEGPGNLRGIRYLFDQNPARDRITQFISFEPGPAGDIIASGIGSKRYHVTFTGPGGHSYDAAGLVNPAYAMADAIVRIGKMTLPIRPKTTINVGLLDGGTSVNAIPAATSMTIDIRSAAAKELADTQAAFLAILPSSVATENAVRSTVAGRVSYTATPIGDRPSGDTPIDEEIVKVAMAAAKAGGLTSTFSEASTDANLPMSRHIPAITLAPGFASDRIHSLDEVMTLDRARDVDSLAIGLATILMLAHAR